jgi:lipoprotein NlpI
LQPKEAEAFAARGELKETRGDLEGAMLDLNTAMGLEPTNLTAISTLAVVKRKSDNLPGALAAFLRATEIAPKSADTFQILGSAQNDSLQYTQALSSFRKAIELDEKNYYSRFWVWMIRTRLGERDDATAELSANLKGRGGDSEHEWELCIGRFLVGELSESNLVAQAGMTAKIPTEVAGHPCEAHYYAGMKAPKSNCGKRRSSRSKKKTRFLQTASCAENFFLFFTAQALHR